MELASQAALILAKSTAILTKKAIMMVSGT